MIRADDRTAEQKTTHRWGVVAKDKFLSGWGQAAGGASRCAWACPSLEAAEHALRWVQARGEMRYVSIVDLNTYRAPRGTAHFHIYVANADHVALRGWVPSQGKGGAS